MDDIEGRWHAAGGHDAPARAGASDDPASPALRALAGELLDELAALPVAAGRGRARRPARAPRGARAASRSRYDRAGLAAPHRRRLARPGGRLRARQAGREAAARGHPRAARVGRALAARRLVQRRGSAARRARALAVEPPQRADEPARDDPRRARGRRPQLHAARARAARAPRAATSRPTTSRRSGSTPLPAGRIFTAERVALPQPARRASSGPPPRRYRNPFREWIGARLRVELHGLTRPGDPRGAAAAAARDARLSHTANGVYAATFMAAACAAAAAGAHPARGRRAGPRRSCRRARGSRRRCARRRRSRRPTLDWEAVVDELERVARRPALGARDQQHRARRGRALPLRARLRRRDLRRRLGRARHRHERRRGRHDRRRGRRPRGDRRALERRRSATASRRRCPASTGSRSASSPSARSR